MAVILELRVQLILLQVTLMTMRMDLAGSASNPNLHGTVMATRPIIQAYVLFMYACMFVLHVLVYTACTDVT